MLRAPRIATAGLLILATSLLVYACGGSKSSTPTGPTPPTAPGGPQTFALAGLVFYAVQGEQAVVPGATIEVVSGANAGQSRTSDAAGRYRFEGLTAGVMTVRATKATYDVMTQSVTLAADQSLNFGLTAPPVVPPEPPPPTQITTLGRLIDALTGAGAGGIQFAGTGLSGGPSAADGAFTATAAASSADARDVVFTGSTVVERRVQMKVPGANVMVSLIPSSFDLRAFDEMFRVPQLLRWTDAPPLMIQSRVLQFTSVSDPEFTAISETMTDGEIDELAGDLAWGLPQLTGDRYSGFASSSRETAAVSARVSALVSGRISVARYAGLTAATGYWGYTRWQYRSDGTVIGGTIMLDRDFEKSGSTFRRSLRLHELGHALGYNHVTARSSVMNSSARLEPNDFDRDACRIAFQRPPGNRAPDIDPSGFSTNRLKGPGIWNKGIH